MQNAQLVYEDKLDVINRSIEGISKDVQYISPKKKYLVYNYATKRTLLNEIKAILDENPEYLLKEEIKFINFLYEVFNKSKIHNEYLISPDNYFSLLDFGIVSIEARILKERRTIVENENEFEIKTKIQFILYQLSEILKVIRSELDENLAKFKKNPYLILTFTKSIYQSIKYLIDAYVFEFQYFRKSEFSEDDIENLLDNVEEFFFEFFSERKELVASILGEKRAILY